jgi:universal stress protein A
MHLPIRILVPVTFDIAGRNALRAAAALAELNDAQLRLIHVWEAPYAAPHIETNTMPPTDGTLIDRLRHECALQLQTFVASCGLDTNGPNLRWSIHSGDPATEILSAIATQGCNWVVMGTHQRSGLDHWLNGSVAEAVLRHATCPVLIVPNALEESPVRTPNNRNGDES